jgi:hypothetical protein
MSHPSLAALATPGGAGVAAPLALRPAARIQERDWEEFLRNPTQLANACRDLVDAIAPNVVIVTSPAVLTEEAVGGPVSTAPHYAAALEAVGRLTESLAHRAAVGVCIPGPSVLVAAGGRTPEQAVAEVTEAGRAALHVGAQVVLIDEPDPVDGASLATLDNIARFHQAYVVVVGEAWGGALGSSIVPLGDRTKGSGLIVTPGELGGVVDISELADWVYDVTS